MEFYHDINQALGAIEVEQGGYDAVRGYLRMVRDSGAARLIFIGNGGSAAIASHMAADYMKNGRFAALCFNDAAAVTCISNDLGYEHVFTLPLQYHAKFGDVLFAISSSGESASILNAANVAGPLKLNIVTLSGFDPENSLRGRGGVNFYVPSKNYGVVEIAHLAILHGLLNEVMT